MITMEKDLKEYLTPPVMLVLFLLAVSLIFIFPVLNMIVLGAILAYGVRPVARKIQSKLKFESISILLAMILVIIPLILLVAYIVFIISGFISEVMIANSNFDIKVAMAQISSYIPQNPFLDANNMASTVQSAVKYVLGYIGGKMLYEGITCNGEEDCGCVKIGLSALLVQGVATSIDALSVGFTISDYDWLMALVCCLVIAIVTFILCSIGLLLGKTFGTKLAGKASILGGSILLIIGIKIFIEGVFLA